MFWTHPDHWGKGYATEGAARVLRFAFEKLGLNRVEILPALDNKKSQRVAEKSGAVMEGIMRKRIVVRDNIYDGVMFSLIREDLDTPD